MSDSSGGAEFDDRFPPPQTSSEGGDASANAPLLVSGTGAGDHSASMGFGAVVGITLAATAAVLMLLGAVVWFRRQRRLQSLATTKKDFELNAVETPYTADAYAGYFRSAALSSTGGGGGRRLQDDSTGTSTRESDRTSKQATDATAARRSSAEATLWDDEQILALRIPRERLAVGTLVSCGGFGEVYAGEYNGQAVAVKLLLPHARLERQQVSAFLAEAKLTAALDHPHIVRFVGVAWDSLTDLCVVSEYMDGGDLRALLTRFDEAERRPHGFDADKVRIAFHVAHALSYLHALEPRVLHRDLKSRNVLLDWQLNAKLIDFGVSRERSDPTTTTAAGGVGASALWMAPEVLLGERYDDKADVFSLGVVLSELDSHALPYATHAVLSADRDASIATLLQRVAQGQVRVTLSANAPQALVDLAAACTQLAPANRPSAVDVAFKLQQALRTYENFVF